MSVPGQAETIIREGIPGPTPRASIIIPAYNEARVIGRCLDALEDAMHDRHNPLPLEIVIAANGCTDRTVDVALRYSEVTVLDIPVGSKSLALNEGDLAATVFPRIYLDADIVLDRRALESMIEVLTTDEARVAAPRIRFHTAESARTVQSFYEVFTELPYVQQGLIGLGVYGLSEAGRARFEVFPDLQADDLFVQRLFSEDERVVTDGHFIVQAPRDLRNLVRVRTRVARGNADLAQTSDPQDISDHADADFSASTSATVRALAQLVAKQPKLLPGAITYAGVTAYARARALKPRSNTWQRDSSTR